MVETTRAGPLLAEPNPPAIELSHAAPEQGREALYHFEEKCIDGRMEAETLNGKAAKAQPGDLVAICKDPIKATSFNPKNDKAEPSSRLSLCANHSGKLTFADEAGRTSPIYAAWRIRR